MSTIATSPATAEPDAPDAPALSLTAIDLRELQTVCGRLPGAWMVETWEDDEENCYAGLVPLHWGNGDAAFWVRREGAHLVLTDRRRTVAFGGLDASAGPDIARFRRRSFLRAVVIAAGGPVKRPEVRRVRAGIGNAIAA